ncbi:MAG TPA: hypothetical protein VGM94_13480 [Galbitalea sp.]|jgi:hypothetical protein
MDDIAADAATRILSDYLVPTLWRADEAQRRLTDVDFEPVFRAAIETAGRNEMLSSFAKYLEGSEAPIELSTLVALPDDGDAHYIDTTTHLISALLISIATDQRLLRGVSLVGKALRHQREQLDRVASGLSSLESATVSPIRERIADATRALHDAIAQGERQEWDRIAAIAIGKEVLGRLQDQVQQRIRDEFTRSAMVAGATTYSVDGRLPWRRLTLPIRMPRSMLLEGQTDADFLAENLGRGIAEGELHLLETHLRKTRSRTFGADQLRDRLLAAAAALPADALDPRALIPADWDAVRQLGEGFAWARADDDDRRVGGRLGPLRVVQIPFDHTDSCYVVATPGPFELVVRGVPEAWLQMSVEAVAIDAQVAEPQVHLVVNEEVVYRLIRGQVIRVAIPGSSVGLAEEAEPRRRNARRARLD